MDRIELNSEKQRFISFKSGDRHAFEFYFEFYFGKITGFCTQFLGDEDEAQNVAQEAFIKLWLNRGKIEKMSGVKSFLYTSAKTQCLDVLRHQAVKNRYKSFKLNECEIAFNREVLSSMNFDDVSFAELEALVEKTILKLPRKCKDVFLKSRYENKKNREIAEELNVSVKAVEANITRALKYLRVELSDYIVFLIFVIFDFFI
ncbi:RNA polymerase sigma-70 factor, ECF subfamily [Arenibacter nanhaiticus]|uniref:RNA polymerase sigma-70 factor, ECF subfamily n=1 Tax=Arenibacter nanhaiticus TaxID=558155 RepID=A0A1M6FBX1_9FLAO|nr:RNA polymerase sigma-70 factor [Arenibacter nanhaiticus]SHI95210.1 RNA polymerase sigma-70 factor, ECF subfamily [Arenibacter nanhaiticus]